MKFLNCPTKNFTVISSSHEYTTESWENEPWTLGSRSQWWIHKVIESNESLEGCSVLKVQSVKVLEILHSRHENRTSVKNPKTQAIAGDLRNPSFEISQYWYPSQIQKFLTFSFLNFRWSKITKTCHEDGRLYLWWKNLSWRRISLSSRSA